MSDRYADLFLAESREHLSAVNEALLALEQGAVPAEPVHALFRAVHTVKGMSAAMGYQAAAAVAHELESVLDRLRSGAVPVDAAVVDALFGAADALEDAVSAAIGGADGSVDAAAALERLHAVAGGHDVEPRPAAPTPIAAAAVAPIAGADARTVHVRLRDGTALPGVRAMLVVRKLEHLGEVLSVSPPLDELQRLERCDAFVIALRGDAAAAVVEEAVRGAGDVVEVRVDAAGARPPAPPRPRSGRRRRRRASASTSAASTPSSTWSASS